MGSKKLKEPHGLQANQSKEKTKVEWLVFFPLVTLTCARKMVAGARRRIWRREWGLTHASLPESAHKLPSNVTFPGIEETSMIRKGSRTVFRGEWLIIRSLTAGR